MAAATETMFCSATPQLTNRSPNRSRSGSRAMKPRSPVKNTKFGFSARATSASQIFCLMPASQAPGSRLYIEVQSAADNVTPSFLRNRGRHFPSESQGQQQRGGLKLLVPEFGATRRGRDRCTVANQRGNQKAVRAAGTSKQPRPSCQILA